MASNRIVYIDSCKLICIILMIWAHCWCGYSHINRYIYLFHMPLFFYVSGMFIKGLDLNDAISKYAKRLLIPYAITSILTLLVLLTLAQIICMPVDKIVINWIKRTLFASAQPGSEFLAQFDFVGPIWFLFGMFWSCTFYSYLKNKYSGITLWGFSLVLFALASISIKGIRLPFSIQAGMGGVLLLQIGQFIKENDLLVKVKMLPKSLVLLMSLTILVLGWNTGLNIGILNYPFGLTSLFVSIIISILLINTVQVMKVFNKWGGVRTLYITNFVLPFNSVEYIPYIGQPIL